MPPHHVSAKIVQTSLEHSEKSKWLRCRLRQRGPCSRSRTSNPPGTDRAPRGISRRRAPFRSATDSISILDDHGVGR